MKVKANILKDFVRKASLNGALMIINLNFTDEGLKSAVRDPGNVAMTMTSLGKDAFVEYEPIGEIFVKNTPSFIKYLKSFNDIIEIEKVEDFIIRLFDDRRQIYVILASESVCKEIIYRGDMPKIETSANIIFDSREIQRTISDLDVLKINHVDIKKEEDVFSFEVGVKGESDFFINTVPFDPLKSKGTGSVTVGPMFVSLFNALDTVVEFRIGAGVPLISIEKEGSMEFICIIAPIVMKE